MNDTIRILHIIKSLGRGGAETLLPETLSLHNQQLFEFRYVYFLPWKDQLVNAIAEKGGKVTCIPASNNFMLMLQLPKVCRYIRENKIQVIHAHLPWAGVMARIAGLVTSVPVLYTEHNKMERYHWITRFMNLATMNLLHQVVGVSADVVQSIRKYKPRLKVPVRTILNGVNTKNFRREEFIHNEVRRKLGIPDDAVVIGTVAVFRSQKRLDLWMELASKILQDFPGTHFVMVGDGPLKEDLIRKREALGLQNRIHMPGLETEVRPYLAIFDIFMMCSVFEGLPVALLEAMAMKCCIVSTDAGGIKEVVRHEIDGLICPVDKPDALLVYVSTLIQDKFLRIKLGEAARERVIQSFDMRKMVSALETLYANAIK